jgi:exonuclease III
MDRIPDFGEPALIHTFTNPVRSSRPAATLQKRHPADLRILSWNVLRDAPLNDRQRERFGNVLRATQPDIVCFQELYTASTPWAIRLVDEFLPLDADQGFWTARKQSDCITVSRFPITDTVAVDNNLITEIDTSGLLGRRSWILNAHTPCCDDQEGRLRETDNFMRLLRQRMEQARDSGEEPFAVFLVGDMNTGSSEREMLTMTEGLIFNTATDGPAFSPDWDDSGLTDVAALHTHDRRIDTWRSLGNRANISRLDYIFYSDSLVMPARSYVLNTRLVPASFRDANALSVLDTEGSDHLPLVADFRPLTLDPPFEATPADGSGWLADTWMGPLYHLDFPPLFSSRHGWLYQVEGRTGPGHWFYHFERGWLWLVPEFYPWAFAERSANWQIL